MIALSQVQKRRNTEKLVFNFQKLTERIEGIFGNTETVGYLSTSRFFNDDANLFGLNFSSYSSLRHFKDDSAMLSTCFSHGLLTRMYLCLMVPLQLYLLLKNNNFGEEYDGLVNI